MTEAELLKRTSDKQVKTVSKPRRREDKVNRNTRWFIELDAVKKKLKGQHGKDQS